MLVKEDEKFAKYLKMQDCTIWSWKIYKLNMGFHWEDYI